MDYQITCFCVCRWWPRWSPKEYSGTGSVNKTFFHDHCAKVKNSFTKFSQSDKQWNCRDCLRDMFPFYELDNKRLKNVLIPQQSEQILNKIQNGSPDCGICYKNDKKKSECLFCKSCEEIFHTKCNTITTTTKEFECIHCIKSRTPFYKIDNIELLNLSFNSIINCSCSHISVNDYGSINATKLSIAEFNPDKDDPYNP